MNEGEKATKFNLLDEHLCVEVVNPIALKDLQKRLEITDDEIN